MLKVIVLDTTPLGLMTQRSGRPEADACQQWAEDWETQGTHFLLPSEEQRTKIEQQYRRGLLTLRERDWRLRIPEVLDGAFDISHIKQINIEEFEAKNPHAADSDWWQHCKAEMQEGSATSSLLGTVVIFTLPVLLGIRSITPVSALPKMPHS